MFAEDGCRAIRRITISNSILFRRFGATFSGLVETGLLSALFSATDPARSTYPELT